MQTLRLASVHMLERLGGINPSMEPASKRNIQDIDEGKRRRDWRLSFEWFWLIAIAGVLCALWTMRHS